MDCKPNSREFYRKFFRVQDRIKHFLRHVDKSLLVERSLNNALERLIKSSFLLSEERSFYFCHKTSGPNYRIDRKGDLLVGIYFPESQVGDTFELTVENCKFPSLIVTDPARVYLPLGDRYIFPMAAGSTFTQIKFRQTKGLPTNIYLIYTWMPTPFRPPLDTSKFVFQIKRTFYCLENGISYKMCDETQCEDARRLTQIELEYYAVKIQRAWRNYVQRKRRKAICLQVRSIPGLGIDYFEGLKRFNKNKNFWVS